MSSEDKDGQYSDEEASAGFEKIAAEPTKRSLSNQDLAEEELGSSVKKHVCQICLRSFSSGKALGGHISSGHRSDMSLKELKSKKKQNGAAGNFGSGPSHECKYCDKEFPSRKSLFGHLRSHPERLCKGMDSDDQDAESDLPDDSSGLGGISFDSEEEEDEEEEEDDEEDVHPVVDLATTLKDSWGVRSQRGRSPVKDNPIPDLEMHLACEQLLSMVRDDDNATSYPQGLGDGQIRSDELNRNMSPEGDKSEFLKSFVNDRKRKKVTAGSGTPNDKAKGKQLMINDESPVQNPNVRRSLEIDREIEDAPPIKRAKAKKAINPTSPEVKFTCDICYKNFGSYQALGGHRSSHFKHKIIIENTCDEAITIISGSITSRAKSAVARGVRNVFSCDICHKTFPNGQALGHHKKTHLPAEMTPTIPSAAQSDTSPATPSQSDMTTPARSDRSPSTKSTSTTETSSSNQAKEQRRPLDFDLNETPDGMELDKESLQDGTGSI